MYAGWLYHVLEGTRIDLSYVNEFFPLKVKHNAPDRLQENWIPIQGMAFIFWARVSPESFLKTGWGEGQYDQSWASEDKVSSRVQTERDELPWAEVEGQGKKAGPWCICYIEEKDRSIVLSGLFWRRQSKAVRNKYDHSDFLHPPSSDFAVPRALGSK